VFKIVHLHLDALHFPFKFAAQRKTADFLWLLHEDAREYTPNRVCGQTGSQKPTDALDCFDSFNRVFTITISEPEGFQQSPLFIVPQGTSAGIRASGQFTDTHIGRMLDIDAGVNV
jgi:hypothetical protein